MELDAAAVFLSRSISLFSIGFHFFFILFRLLFFNLPSPLPPPPCLFDSPDPLYADKNTYGRLLLLPVKRSAISMKRIAVKSTLFSIYFYYIDPPAFLQQSNALASLSFISSTRHRRRRVQYFSPSPPTVSFRPRRRLSCVARPTRRKFIVTLIAAADIV